MLWKIHQNILLPIIFWYIREYFKFIWNLIEEMLNYVAMKRHKTPTTYLQYKLSRIYCLTILGFHHKIST